MSTTDPRMSRYGQYQQQQPVPTGLLALSISTATTHRYQTYGNGGGVAGVGANNGHSYNQRMSESFQFDSESDEEQEIDEFGHDTTTDSGRRHAAPSKRRIAAMKQQQQQQQRLNANGGNINHNSGGSGVFLETDIDTGEVQVRSVSSNNNNNGDVVRSARSVGDLLPSPGGSASKNGGDSSMRSAGVSPSDRDKSRSVNFGDSEKSNLMKRPSQHDMRVDKSLERINVPEWYREGGDDEEDRRIFRLRSVHNDDDDEDREMRKSAFSRTKSAPPSRKTSTSNVNAIDAIKQSRMWALSRAVGAESRASTTASSVASNFRRPSVRYNERDSSLRRPKPIAIRPLEAMIAGAQSQSNGRSSKSPNPPHNFMDPRYHETSLSERKTTEIEVKTSSFSVQRVTETTFDANNNHYTTSPPSRFINANNGVPLHVETKHVEQPKTRKAEHRAFSPVHVPVQIVAPPPAVLKQPSPPQRVASPPGPPTLPKPRRQASASPSVSPVHTNGVSNGGLLVTQEEFRAPTIAVPTYPNAAATNGHHASSGIVSPASTTGTTDGRRPVLLVGYNEAEFIDDGTVHVQEPSTAAITTHVVENIIENGTALGNGTVKTKVNHSVKSSSSPERAVLFTNGYQPVVTSVLEPEAASVSPSGSFEPGNFVSLQPQHQQMNGNHHHRDSVEVTLDGCVRVKSPEATVTSPIRYSRTVSPLSFQHQSDLQRSPSPQIIVQEPMVGLPAVPPSTTAASGMSWHTTTVLSAQGAEEEIVIDTAVQVSTRRSGSGGATTVAPPHSAINGNGENGYHHHSNGDDDENIMQPQVITPVSNNSLEADNNNAKPSALTRATTNGHNGHANSNPSVVSSFRASFKKPGKFLAKLWKDKQQQPGNGQPVVSNGSTTTAPTSTISEERSDDALATQIIPPSVTVPENMHDSILRDSVNNRPLLSGSSTMPNVSASHKHREPSLPPPPPPPPAAPAEINNSSINNSSLNTSGVEAITTATTTNGMTNGNSKSSTGTKFGFRAFWKTKPSGADRASRDLDQSLTTSTISATSPVLNDSIEQETYVVDEAQISRMNGERYAKSTKKPVPVAAATAAATSSQPQWVSGRSPFQPQQANNSSYVENHSNNVSLNSSSIRQEEIFSPAKHHNETMNSSTTSNSSRLRSGPWMPRDDVEAMMGDAPAGFTLCEIPDEPPRLPAVPQPRTQTAPLHHLSHSSIATTNKDKDNNDSLSVHRDVDAVSTTSSKKKSKTSFFGSITPKLTRSYHDEDRYERPIPPPSGEAASWLHRRDVGQLVNNAVLRPSAPNTPGPGSPVSGRSMTMPSSKTIGSDGFSLSRLSQQQQQPSSSTYQQRQQPQHDTTSLSTSYHGGMSTSSYSLSQQQHQHQQQQQPPSGPYSRHISSRNGLDSSSAASHNSAYQAQMAHQQKIRAMPSSATSSSSQVQMPPPPSRLHPVPVPPPPNIPSAPVDYSPLVTCQRPGCTHTVSAEQARTSFRICSSCASAFCSRQCREAHLVGNVGRRKCPLDNVRDLCQRAAKRLETDRLLLSLLSQFARLSYLCHGRGYVYAHFSGPERASAFANGQMGLHSLALEFHTITHTEAALMRGEPLDEVMDLLQAYNPESKLVLCVGVSVASERPHPLSARPSHGGGGIGSSSNQMTSWDTASLDDLNSGGGESRVVLRAAKLRLAVPRPGSLRALMLVSAGVAFQNRRGSSHRLRELTFSNIQLHLKRRGVDLLASHPNVYTRLTQYVAATQEFPPTGLCIWDDAVGRSLLALIFPDALPRQDWLRSMHQLGDIELGLPDPRQLAMGVDV